MSTARLAVSAFCLATLGACAGMRAATAPAGPALPPESFSLAGGSVAIHDPAGSVRVEPGSGPDVRVMVTRYGADANRLRVEREARAGGDILRIRVEGPSSRRLLYPGMPGRSDSIQFRATSSGFAPGRGGFLGLFGGRSLNVVRRPVKTPATEAHADMVVSVPPGRRVDLHVGAGAVAVTGDVGELHVRSLVGDFDLPSAAGRIFVSSNSGGVFGRGGSGELTVTSRAGSVDLASFTGSRVEVTTAAGSIRGAALSANQLRLRAGAGDIDVAGARARSVQLGSGSGRVTARDLVADTLLAISGIGDLALPGLRAGTALLRTRRGDVLADLAAVPSSLRVAAHGFVVLSERADFVYRCTDYYAPTDERSILWNDPASAVANDPRAATTSAAHKNHLSHGMV